MKLTLSALLALWAKTANATGGGTRGASVAKEGALLPQQANTIVASMSHVANEQDRRALNPAPTITCPPPGSSMILTDVVGLLNVEISGLGALCMLSQSNGEDLLSVARSYDGNDWEPYAGPFRASPIACTSTDCLFELEATTQGFEYILTSFSHEPDSPADEAARFLETATFGTTRNDLASLDMSNLKRSFGTWIQQQMALGVTSHREFFRTHANARVTAASRLAPIRAPCEVGTRYRRFTFVETDHKRDLTISSVGTKRLLSFGTSKMTMVEGPLYDKGENFEILDGSYYMCRPPEEKLYGDFRIIVDGNCISTSLGNPPIQFDGNEMPANLINLDGKAEIHSDDYYGAISNNLYPEQTIIITSDVDSPACGTPLDEIYFGQFNDQLWIRDRTYKVKDNKLEAPLLDGGKSIIEETGGIAICANVPRTFLNENHCQLSFEFPCTTRPTLNAAKGVLVCGSPGEVANDPFLGAKAPFHGALGFIKSTSPIEDVKEVVWAELAVRAPDQLRQRMAWALSQILVVTQRDIKARSPDSYMTFYDIFTRGAFGNYRDILKEVSFSPLMATMLSFDRNLSRQKQFEDVGEPDSFPDENYAREIMQLFTCGLDMLNDDGTPILDANDVPVPTYTNDDITEYARVWTGFRTNAIRSNMDGALSAPNRVDPMYIEISWRDWFPKLGLQKKYIGEGLPLCSDLPHGHFLRKGAKYRLLGSSPEPELHADHRTWATQSDTVRFSVDMSDESPSNLYLKLCNPVDPTDPTSSCQFAPVVMLPENLECIGRECNVETVTTVEVVDGVFYEYIQPPCAHQAFYKNVKKIKKTGDSEAAMCADPKVANAAPICCDSPTSIEGSAPLEYWGEHVTFVENEARCASQSMYMCNRNKCRGQACKSNPFFWATEPCFLKVKINAEGMVAIVHEAVLDLGEGTDSLSPPAVREDSVSYFRVEWEQSEVVDEIIETCQAPCIVSSDDSCLCYTTLEEEVAFSLSPGSVEEVLKLSIGAFDADFLGEEYSVAGTEEIKVFYLGSEQFTMDTIFEVVNPLTGKTERRKNVKSTVQVDGYEHAKFRNPLHMISLSHPLSRDAYHETDAALDSYLYHPSTAPFLAKLLVQRFGISNPSPRYVSVITNAFRSGRYTYNDTEPSISYGSGIYGDLAATTAAILLDREARAYLLDADPTFGAMREPIVKVMALMRNLEFTSKPSTFIFFNKHHNMQDVIGQYAYQAPSVFSFFPTDFIPRGPLKTAQLSSPESNIHVGQLIVSTLNGMSALLKYGLDSCWGGFGWHGGNNCNARRQPGVSTYSHGAMTYWYTASSTANEVVSELATIMTSGRLSAERRAIMERVYDEEPDKRYAAIKVEELITLTPEFHASGVSSFSGDTREPTADPTPSNRPYKAVVLLTFPGGMDSYNLLVPHECEGTNSDGLNLHEQYEAVRLGLSFKPEERTEIIDTLGQGQPCSKFAIHDELPILKRLYDSGDLSFFANMGVLDQEMNKDNYEAKSRTKLFSHKSMRYEAERVDPFDDIVGTGVLGRMSDVLADHGYSRALVAIDQPSTSVEGGELAQPYVLSSDGIDKFNEKPTAESAYDVEALFMELNNATTMQSSMFGETWSQHAINAVSESDQLFEIVGHGSTGPRETASAEAIATMMKAHEVRGVDRDFFHVSVGVWDTHSDMKTRLREQLKLVQKFLEKFESEVKKVDNGALWNKVALVTASDFGRTLTPNSNAGSDHGWAGHYFMMGGQVAGQKIHGQYPSDISPGADLDVGRGRLMPTLSWEAMWNGVAQWMGVPDLDMTKVIPNLHVTGSDEIFTKEQLFEEVF